MRDPVARNTKRPRSKSTLVVSNTAGVICPDLDPLVQLLRDPHRDRRREAELLRGLLLQRAGAERRRRGPAPLALLDRRDVERQLQRFGDDRPRGGFVLDLRLLAVELVQPRLERLAVRSEERRVGTG